MAYTVSVSTRAVGQGRVAWETWFGQLGDVRQIKYTWNNPGGPATLSCHVVCDPRTRHAALTPGRTLTCWAGGAEMWSGILDQPTPAADGFDVTAVGIGSAGNTAVAYNTDNAFKTDLEVAAAISRGALPWQPATNYPTRVWGAADKGSISITDSVTWLASWNEGWWRVNANGVLSFPTPIHSPDRMLLATSTAGGRTVDAFANALICKYTQIGGVTDPGYVVVTDDRSIAKFGRVEQLADFTQFGATPQADIIAAANLTLTRFGHRSRWTGSFTCSRGMVLMPNGGPEEPCNVKPGHMFQVAVVNPDPAGDVDPTANLFVGGETAYDSETDTVTITPQEAAFSDLSSALVNPQVLHRLTHR